MGDSEGEQDDFPNYLSNMKEQQGGARYISRRHMINNTGEISKNNGYKRYAQWWDLTGKDFVSEFVDPITGDTPGTY